MVRSMLTLCFAAYLCFSWGNNTRSHAEGAAERSLWVFVAGDGIHVYDFDLKTGVLKQQGDAQDAKPSFLAIHPNGRFLYGAGKGISAFSIDGQSGKLSFLNAVAYDKHGLCHLYVDKTGANVLAAGYGAGTVVVQRIVEDGRLGEQSALVKHEGSSVNASRQSAPHAHSVNLDADNNFAFAADLGVDKVLIYRFDAAQGTLEPAEHPAATLAPGAGPRHFTFHPNGRLAYVINELDSTITSFRYDPTKGSLVEIETVTTLPKGFEGENYTAEVVVHPGGRFLYGSNRGHNSIAVYSIDVSNGKLTMIEQTPTGGVWPRNFCVDPTGQYLLAANQKSDSVHVFRIDQQTGRLERTDHSIEVPAPSCIRFLRKP